VSLAAAGAVGDVVVAVVASSILLVEFSFHSLNFVVLEDIAHALTVLFVFSSSPSFSSPPFLLSLLLCGLGSL
jgi:hypothetical protein